MKYYQEQEKEKKKLPFEKKLTLIIGVIIATIVVLGCVWYFAAYRKGIGRWVKTTEPTCTEYGYMTKVGLFGKEESERISPLGHDMVNNICRRCNSTANTKNLEFTVFSSGTKTSVSKINYALGAVADVSVPTEYNGVRVAEINRRVFADSLGMSTITLPDSITGIGADAFDGCTNLKVVYYAGTIEQWVKISFGTERSNPLYYADNLYVDGKLVETVEISESTQIKDYAFINYKALTKFVAGENVETIGARAFYGCERLSEVVGLNNIRLVKSEAFEECGDRLTVYYHGSRSQWESVAVMAGNERLTSDTGVYFYSETQPDESGNYWYYDESGNPEKW